MNALKTHHLMITGNLLRRYGGGVYVVRLQLVRLLVLCMYMLIRQIAFAIVYF